MVETGPAAPAFPAADPRARAQDRRPRRRRLLAVGLVRCAALLLAWQAARAEDIVVGQTLALSGPSATIARDLLRGRQACVDYVNAHGGIRGNALKLLTRDDQGDPARAVRLDREMVGRDGAVAMLGAMGPAVNTAMLEWAQAAGVTVVGPFGGDIENRVSNADTAYFLTANQGAEAERLAQHIASLGFSRVVMVHAGDQAGQAAMVALEEGLAENNISAIELVAVRPDGSDAAAAALRVSRAGAQAVLLATSGRATVAALRALAAGSSGAMPLLQVYGLSSAASQADLAELGDRARGFSMSQVMPLPRDPSVPVVATFLAAMRNAPGERTYPELEGCMAPLLLAEVLRHKSAEPTRAGVLKAMRNAGRVDLGGFEVDLANRSRPGARFTDIVYVGGDGRIAR
jgi:ABC-type branched-subunit amino acid transport system substrate-binding protein